MTPFPTLGRDELATATGGAHRHHLRRRPEPASAARQSVAPAEDTGAIPDAGRTAASYRKPLRLF